MKTNVSSEMDNACGKQSLPWNAIKRWYTKSAKLAVAVAIIKSKPPGRSGRQYAEQLAARFNHLEQSWKTKAEGLQEEVLRLRQELLLSKMLSKNNGHGDGFMEVISQDLRPYSGPQLSGTEQTSTEPDSGCGTENNSESLLQTWSVKKGQTIYEISSSIPTHPRQPHFPQLSTDPRESALLSHMQFLQNLCGLRKVDARGLSLDGHGSVVWDSVCQLLGSLAPASRDDPRHVQKALLLQASQLVVQALEEWRALCKPPGPFLTQAEDCLKKLTDHLLNNSQLNRFPWQDCLSDCLIRLGGSATLRPALLRLLLSHINHLAHHLWLTCQETASTRMAPLEVECYENSFYLLWVLEQVLRDGGSSGLSEAHGQLERQVVRLADEYPLFSLYLWRIGALLKPDVSTAAPPNAVD